MNMTFDGWLVVATEHGYVVAISRDFTSTASSACAHSEGAEEKATRPTGYGWVRNGIAIDDAGGVYVASPGAHAQGRLDRRPPLAPTRPTAPGPRVI